MFKSWLEGGVQETLKKRKNRRKTLKNEEKGKRRIQTKSTTINIFAFTFYVKNYILLENMFF